MDTLRSDILDQFWIVGDNGSRAWSSAAGAYLTEWPAESIVIRIPSETSLSEVLARNGLPGPIVLPDDVKVERDRRIFSGFVFNGVRFQSRLEDQKRIAGAGTLALAAIISGAQPGDLRWHGGESDLTWIAEDNSLVTMDAQTVIAFGKAAAQWEAAHVFAARALKDADPIPVEYTDDQYWP